MYYYNTNFENEDNISEITDSLVSHGESDKFYLLRMMQNLSEVTGISPLTNDIFQILDESDFSIFENVSDDLDLVFSVSPSPLKDFQLTVNNGNGVESTFHLTFKDISKLPHELVSFYLFGDVSDKKLSTISTLGDQSDRQTPDCIKKIENRWVVAEVKTVRTNALCEQRYKESLEIYKDAVLRRPEDIYLFSVCTSPNKVVTNLSIGDKESLVIMSLYNLGLKIQDHFRELGWHSEDLDGIVDVNRLYRAMSKMTIPTSSDDPLIITKDDLSRWRALKPTMSKYMKHFSSAMNEAKAENAESSIVVTRKRIEDHRASLKNGRMTMKSPIQLPLFYVHCKSTEESLYRALSDCSLLERVWRSALVSKMMNPERWEEIDPKSTLEKALSDDPPQVEENSSKSFKFRVEIELSSTDWVELSKSGVEAKVKRDVPDLIYHRLREKEPFSIDCPDDDIERFIKTKSFLDRIGVDNPLSMKILPIEEKILGKRYGACQEFVNNFFGTKLGLSLTSLQAVLMEVNISRLQNCKPGTFVLKYVELAGVYVLIKPTKASEHIFFSVACPPSTEFVGKPFKEPYNIRDGWTLYDFVSTDTNRLTHAIACPERACSLLAMWCQLFDTLPKYVFSSNEPDIVEHFLASLLFYMEDKESTSSSLQSIRYAYMEMVKGPDRKLDPLKVLSKMHDRPRSRLLTWAMKRVHVAFQKMVENPPTYGLRSVEEMAAETSQDVAHNLLSWVTLRTIPKFEIALNLSYFGVLHNKEEGDKIHGFLKIFEKVIKEERELKHCNPLYLGKEEPPENHSYRSHEFSPEFVALSGRAVRTHLETKGGGMKWIINKIETMLASKTILELATMKASAIEISEKNFEPGLKLNKRQKTAESIKEFVDQGICGQYMYDIDQIYGRVSLDGGIRANLFKKLQIGGTREIFVLNMQSRMLVHFCESICRTVCEQLPNEMLTKGDQKLLRNDSHFKKLNSLSGENSVTVTSSDDATTWAQRFVMPAFACFLCQIFDDDIMVPLAAVLNECTKKKLELPSELLSLFVKNPTVDAYSDQINELKSQFFGLSQDRDLLEPRSVLLKNRSNMMQGIFHYTSSLFHAGFLLQWSSFSSEAIRRICPVIQDHVITTKVSSDDSSVLISTRFNKEKHRRNISILFYALTLLKRDLYKYMCCKQSEEKSTVGVFWTIEEFNSNWLMRNTILMPLIKFVVSATQVHTTPKIESRLHVMATLRSQVVENCGSIMLAAIIQQCQSRLHYLSLGAATSKMWKYYVDYLAEAPHPSCGLMPFEPDNVCGLLGYDFSLYSWLSKSKKAMAVHERLVRNLGIEFSKDGSQNSRVFLSHGQNMKYNEFLRKMGLEDKLMFIEDTNDIISREPSVLYRSANTQEEFRLKLLLKCSDPEMSQSFSFLNASKIYASSVYILQEPCLHLVNGFNNDGSVRIHKCSLLKWVRLVIENLKTPDEDYVKLSFPSWQFYDKILYESELLKDKPLVPAMKRRRIFITVPIPKQSTLTPMTLMDCLKRIWFKLPVRGSNSSCEATFEYFKAYYPWISRDYRETILNGPFGTHTSLYKFVMSLSPQNKSVRMATPSRSLQSGFKTLIDSVIRNQWPSHIILEGTIDRKVIENVTDSLMYSLWLAKNAPPTQPPRHLIESICKSVPKIISDTPNLADIMTQGIDRFNIMITQLAVYEPSSVIPMLKKYNKGVFGGYTERQKQTETGSYFGRGIYSGSIDGVKFQIFIKDDHVHTLKVESVSSFLPKTSTFQSFLQDQKLILRSEKTLNSRYLNHRGEVGPWGVMSCRIIEADVPLHYENKDVHVECDDQGRIRIKTNEKPSVTVLSFVPSVRHVNTMGYLRSETKDPLIDTWNNFEKYDLDQSYDLIKRRKPDPLQEWLCKSLLHRLSASGYDIFRLPRVQNVIEQPVSLQREDQNLMGDLYADDDDMDFSAFFIFEEEDEVEALGKKDIEAAVDDMDEIYHNLFAFADDMIIRQPIKKMIEPNVFRIHPFWDNYIEDLADHFGPTNVQKAISGLKARDEDLKIFKEFLDYCEVYAMYDNKKL